MTASWLQVAGFTAVYLVIVGLGWLATQWHAEPDDF